MSKRTPMLLLAASLFVAGAARAQDRAAITAGGEIYAEKCADCHGPRMAATGAGADLRELRADDREKFEKTIKEGRGQMPSWDGQLTREQIELLWAYQRSRAND